jgi:hypothetical protein
VWAHASDDPSGIGTLTSMPAEFTREGLERLGVLGFVPVHALREQMALMRAIPRDEGGVYLAFRDSAGPPRFRRVNPAGTWRGDPTLPLEELRRRWVDGSPIVYVGKADLTPSTNLRKRISAYLQFGAGSNARHSGGYPDVAAGRQRSPADRMADRTSAEDAARRRGSTLCRAPGPVWGPAVRELRVTR